MHACQQCGHPAASGAVFCANCAATAQLLDPSPYAPPRAPLAQLPSWPADLPPKWQVRFALLEKAGGVHEPKASALTLRESLRLHVNFLALIFGPIYYAWLGMWRKALSYTAFLIIGLGFTRAIVEQLGFPNETFDRVARLVVPLVFSNLACVDYYKKMVFDENGWW